MKYVIILADGMADDPIKSLSGKTPMEAAKTPHFDRLAQKGEVGLIQNVPQGMIPGSDVANLSVMGYDPAVFYTGRSPLEAVSIGIPLTESDVTLRCNFVTLSDEEIYEEKTMVDYSAGEISTEEANELIEFLRPRFADDDISLCTGVSYRHCMVVRNGTTGSVLTPPYDISDKRIAPYLPRGVCGDRYLAIMKKSHALLKDHPITKARLAAGKKAANSVWLWGEGTKPSLSSFYERTGLRGGVISAVDLIRGIGIAAGMDVISVPGITGNYDTNFSGKAEACADALLGGLDFVYVHLEAPDECGHQGDLAHKIFSIEQIDAMVGRITARLQAAAEDFSLLVLPDHPTPIAIKTHTSNPVPYLLYRSDEEKENDFPFSEKGGLASGNFMPRGHEMMQKFLTR